MGAAVLRLVVFLVVVAVALVFLLLVLLLLLATVERGEDVFLGDSFFSLLSPVSARVQV